MQVVFLPGGCINEFGPFECGEKIDVPKAIALDLLANGLANPIEAKSRKPLTFSFKPVKEQGALDV